MSVEVDVCAIGSKAEKFLKDWMLIWSLRFLILETVLKLMM